MPLSAFDVRLMDTVPFFLPDWPLTPRPLFWVALAVVCAALAGEWVNKRFSLPRITAYSVVGMLLAGLAGFGISPDHGAWLQRGLDVALAILLFELGSRVDLRWLKYNRWLLITSLFEAGAAFLAVFVVSRYLGMTMAPSIMLGIIGMATSPVVVVRVVAECKAQGQISTRLQVLTALNTIYAVVGVHVALGVAHQRYSGDWMLAVTHPMYLLCGNIVIGKMLATVVGRLRGWLRFNDEYASLVLLGVVLLTISLIEALRLQASLCMLFAGILLRNSDRRAWVFPQHLGSVGGVLVVMLFLVVGMSIEIDQVLVGCVMALALLGARSLAKLCGVLVLARPSGISLKQGLALGLALSPAAGPVMLATSDFIRIYPDLRNTLLPVVVSAVAIMELLGPVIVALCLRWGGERRE